MRNANGPGAANASAIAKAYRKGEPDLADTVYSAVPARLFGRAQEIDIGPLSGPSNVAFWLERRGLRADEALVDRIFDAAKVSPTVLTDEEILRIIEVVAGEHDRDEAPQMSKVRSSSSGA